MTAKMVIGVLGAVVTCAGLIVDIVLDGTK